MNPICYVTRRCKFCGEWKELTEHNFRLATIRGQRVQLWKCWPCMMTAQRAWKLENKERLAARRRADYAMRRGLFHAVELARAAKSPIKYQAQRLKNSVLERCRELKVGKPEWVTTEYIEAWIRRQPNCPCCGVTLNCARKKGTWRYDSPSFDRFDPKAGYELANVSLICWRCNNIKRNYTADDLRRVAAWMDVWGNQTERFQQEPAAA